MKDNIVKLIKECIIFSTLDLEVCEKIADLFEPFSLQQDEILFNQGDASDYFYILTSGTLMAMVLAGDGSKFVGTIESGETVGELGAISGELRTLTIRAAHHSRLLRLSSQNFIKLCHQYPSILLETIKPIISRSQKNIQLLSPEKKCDYIGIIIHKNEKLFDKIMNRFLINTPKNADYTLIFDSKADPKTISKNLSDLEKKYHSIIVILDSGESSLSKIILEKANTLYFIHEDNSNTEFDSFSKSILCNDEYRKKIKFELVLTHNNDHYIQTNTSRWIAKEDFFQIHHLRIGIDQDYQRMLRFFSGHAIGLVLGGGGARAWLHVGVLKALLEAKIPIDAVGGTSAGSCICGAYLVTHGNFDKLLELSNQFMRASGPPFTLKDFTWPMISFLSAERVTNGLKNVFHDLLIEDLWLPFFCISTNLSTYKEESHHHGSLFEKVRASIAIPGVFPPMMINNNIHYDGALCNNLPVDVMRNIVGSKGKIIAVGLTSYHETEVEYSFPPVLPFGRLLAQKFGFGRDYYRFPPFFDTFYSVLTFGSYTKEKDNAAFADILIKPNISNYALLKLKKHQEKELLKIGHKEFSKALENWKYNASSGIFEKKSI